MGSCISAPVDVKASNTVNIACEDGTDEASLMFPSVAHLSSKITISLECHNLPRLDIGSKSDPFLVLYQKDTNGKWYEVGRTEVVVNTQNPMFVKKILMNYMFEEIQVMRCVVYDADEAGDSSTLSLGDQDYCCEAIFKLPDAIHCSKAYTTPLNRNGKEHGELAVKCEQLNKSSGDIEFTLHANYLPAKSFLRISNILFIPLFSLFNLIYPNHNPNYNPNHNPTDAQSTITPVYKSEVSVDGRWKTFRIDVCILCNVDYKRPLILEVFQYNARGNHKLIGCHRTSTEDLLGSVEQTFPLVDGSQTGTSITIDQCSFQPKRSFLEFVQSGLDINFMVAIDFTGSNGNPSHPSSLHYTNANYFMAGKYNQYERSIITIGNVIEFYDRDRMFPVYGFGAVLPPNMTVNHCFPLNGNPSNPEVYGVSGIMDIYHHAISTVRLSGPTFFNSILCQAKQISQMIKASRDKYLILLILTDGEIHDMEATISSIIDSCDLPMSILIVGVGEDDFENMEKLDGDKHTLSMNGRKATRDIVQFVALRDVESFPPEKIAQQLLAEVPRQVTSYMKKEGITPEEIQQRHAQNTISSVPPMTSAY